MSNSLQMVLNPTTAEQSQYTQPAVNEMDNWNLLPTDDQLDQLVDNLCENFPALKLKLDFDGSVNSSISPENLDSTNVQEPIVNEPVPDDARVNSIPVYNSPKAQRALKSESTLHTAKNSVCDVGEYRSDCKLMGTLCERRPSSNSNLNVAIMQCTSSLEHLAEKRKSLELLVQVHHNVSNVNYNVSYTPRLPDAPTRVDRLVYDVSQERCRVLGLMSQLEKTMSSFASKSTNDNMRQLLVAYGKAVIDVIKERQSEMNYSGNYASYDSRVSKLVLLVDEMNRYTRRVNTALWCIEFKEQVDMVMSQKRAHHQQLKTTNSGPKSPVVGMMAFQKPWLVMRSPQQPHKQQSQQRFQKTPPSSKAPKPPNGLGQQKKCRQHPMCMGMVQHQQTTIYQVIPSSPKERKTTAVQLYAQHQRAEIFRRYSASLKNNHRNLGFK